MSVLNFLGELALFDMIKRWFSSPQSAHVPPVISKSNAHPHAKISDRHNVDRLRDKLDQLESELDDCDIMSDRYDDLQDMIDTLIDRIDEIEYDDYYDDTDDDF